jgi:hypothetical protein
MRPVRVLRIELQKENAASLDQDQTCVRERHDLPRRVRREPSLQDPNELIGLGDGDPVEISTKGALFQQSERDHVKQLGLVLAMRNEKENVSIPFLTVLEELFDGRTSTGP